SDPQALVAVLASHHPRRDPVRPAHLAPTGCAPHAICYPTASGPPPRALVAPRGARQAPLHALPALLSHRRGTGGFLLHPPESGRTAVERGLRAFDRLRRRSHREEAAQPLPSRRARP